MSKFMLIAGLLLAAVGAALGLLVFFSPGKIMALGIQPDVAATLLTGGILAMGLGGVISALGTHGRDHGHHHDHGPVEMPVVIAKPAAVVAAAATSAAQASSAVVEPVAEAAKTTTAEAVAALERAKTDIAEALGLPPPEASAAEAEPEAEEIATVPEDGELFVVEEKEIRGKPARLLSDGTVEAETDEGWMRFENMEHLEEYLDAMAPVAKG
jgi:hypothetical protein